jgi:isoaspartyl peptidase/L-asparaginase-like protein (Ntn-hydrolase superfamily)
MVNAVLIHGGAGSPSSMSSILEDILKNIKFENDPLIMAISPVRSMEDNPLFNAGTGSVPRIDGSIQMDAAVMSGKEFGSVICIENVKNPVLVARDVMIRSPHIMLSGDGATEFAREMGYGYYNPATERGTERLKKFQEEVAKNGFPDKFKFLEKKSEDTVGAVARIGGNFAAAVSTGGSFPMLRGRVGDSPIIGAGIYAGEKGAVVATGIGEEIARKLLSYHIYAQMGNESLETIVKREVNSFTVSCGIIAITGDEYISYSNTTMAYAYREF